MHAKVLGYQPSPLSGFYIILQSACFIYQYISSHDDVFQNRRDINNKPQTLVFDFCDTNILTSENIWQIFDKLDKLYLNRVSRPKSKIKVSPILKISWKKMEKCKSLRFLSEDNFTKIANWDMGNFVHFWRYYGLSSHISIDIELYITENM